MTFVELVARLKEEAKGLTVYLTDPTDYNNAIDDAQMETGFTLPATVSFKEYWLKERAKRHLYSYLRAEAASKFKAKKFNLEQRFEHYHRLIIQMDAEYYKAVEERPDMFSGANVYDMFGTLANAGFQYDRIGRDTTYKEDNMVEFWPNEVS